jgi:hypothetical protein
MPSRQFYKIEDDRSSKDVSKMNWYGKEPLQPKYTKKLVTMWQAPPGNSAEHYYDLFPDLYPYYLPDDHHIVKYDLTKYPKHRDYRTFKSAPKEIKSSHRIEWEDGYGPCTVCDICKKAAKDNAEQSADYYRRLAAWRENGTPM